MPTYEENRADPFSITVLIAIVLIMVFLIISTIYFSNLMKFKPPSKSESTFLFWTALLLTIVTAAIAVLAIIHIFTHKHITHIVENKIIAPKTPRGSSPPKLPPIATSTQRSRSPDRTGNDDGFRTKNYADTSLNRRQKTAQKLSLFSEAEAS